MTFNKYITLALLCLISLCVTSCGAGRSSALTPMESIVCQVGRKWCIVRDDQTRHNPLTLRDRKTLEPVFDAKFESYNDTFEYQGKPCIEVESWHPAFGYIWSAWIYDGRNWVQMQMQPQPGSSNDSGGSHPHEHGQTSESQPY